MNTVARSSRPFGVVLLAALAGALLLLTQHQDLAAQTANGKPDFDPPGWRIKHDVPPGPPWKHDPPPGPPCAKVDVPCPPGYDRLKPTLNPPRNGHASATELVFAPSDLLVELVTQAEAANLPMPLQVPEQAQHRLHRVMVGGEAPEVTDLAQALLARGNDGARTEVIGLVAALQALPYGNEYLPRAAEAFNAFLDASSETFLRNPVPEFLVVHAFLGRLVNEALSAPDA